MIQMQKMQLINIYIYIYIYCNLQTTERFKWTYEQEKKLIELFDEAISMSNYSLKDPKAHGRVYG